MLLGYDSMEKHSMPCFPQSVAKNPNLNHMVHLKLYILALLLFYVTFHILF